MVSPEERMDLHMIFFFEHLHYVRFNNFGVTGGPEVEDSNPLKVFSGYESFQDLCTTSLTVHSVLAPEG